jgi:hypothetical protein
MIYLIKLMGYIYDFTRLEPNIQTQIATAK